MSKLTPMMEQYVNIKKQYQDSILFFRLGDFYEMFFEDAELGSRELEITLTKRGDGIPMAGVPHHSAQPYIAKLINKGYKVAICEQTEDPEEAEGIVDRAVVKVITPGTITDLTVLDEKSNNYLAAIYYSNYGVGFTFVDNSTGELETTEFVGEKIELLSFLLNEITKINPSEILINNTMKDSKFINDLRHSINPYISYYDDKIDFEAKDIIIKQFSQMIYNTSGISDKVYSQISTAVLINYLKDTEMTDLNHLQEIKYFEPNSYMILDYNTRKNLEIDETIIKRELKGSLLGFLDKTTTAMGGRLFRKWLERPLINKSEIEYRNNIVEFFVNDLNIRDMLIEELRYVYDIERLSSKISNKTVNARELNSLKQSIQRLPKIKEILKISNNKALIELSNQLDDLKDIYNLIDSAIVDDPPILITEGGIIKNGYDPKLDEILEIKEKANQWLQDLELKEKEESGIKNLKIGFNKMLGYFFEVTKSNIDNVPEYFIRRQTLTNSERYFTDELKSMEDKILRAEEESVNYEYKVFLELREKLEWAVDRINETSKIISKIDVLISFSIAAYENSYIRPSINYKGILDIKDGRHPVVEESMDKIDFIPNDSFLDLDEEMVQIITGPNMSGKSTYMRQIAIITIMAHLGSFVPASYANIPITDRVFTRIGASDNLAQGQSTFMVEMVEVANIIDTATSQSLIILDEVGRGTSTYDGLSIAWALVEYIVENLKAKTLFATHYHELTQLADDYKEINNLTISSKKVGEDIIFLRKVIKGSTSKSYGIQVARLAGINNRIIYRANVILNSIEKDNHFELKNIEENTENQLNIADIEKNLLMNKLSQIDVDNLTPRQSLDLLYELVEEAKGLNSE